MKSDLMLRRLFLLVGRWGPVSACGTVRREKKRIIWIEFCIWRAPNDEILMTFRRLRLRENFDLKVARAT